MKTTPDVKSPMRFRIGLAGAVIAIGDLYLVYVEAMYTCPLDYNLGNALLITIVTLGIPIIIAAVIGSAAALRSPHRVRLGLLATSVLLLGALPFVNALPHAVPAVGNVTCPGMDF